MEIVNVQQLLYEGKNATGRQADIPGRDAAVIQKSARRLSLGLTEFAMCRWLKCAWGPWNRQQPLTELLRLLQTGRSRLHHRPISSSSICRGNDIQRL